MKTIHKYELAIHGRCVVPMPAGARLLSVGNQGGGLVIWAEVDDAQPLVPRLIESRYTGQCIGGGVGEYVGTATLPAPEDTAVEVRLLPNSLVVHVYDLPPAPSVRLPQPNG